MIRHSLSEFLDVIRANPNSTVSFLARKVGCEPRSIQKFLKQLEVVGVVGRCPETGRGGVKLWSVKLPKEKQKALKVGA